MQPLGVIFDMDGVLVNSYDAHLESWQRSARQRNVEMSRDNFARTFGRTSREIIRELWPGRFSEEKVGDFDQAKEQAYRDILAAKFPEMDGADELIRALHAAGFRLAIGSSGPPPNVELVHRQLKSGSLITATVDGTQVKHGKPEPDVFLAAAAKLGVDPKYAAVIEDAPAGIEAARRAGMTAIALTGTATRVELAKRAHLVVDSLRELNPARAESLIRQNAAASP